MKKRFTGDTELIIVTNLNEADEPDEEIEVFRKGEEIEFDVIDHPQRFDMDIGKLVEDTSLINIQFGDGSMAFGVDLEWLEDVN